MTDEERQNMMDFILAQQAQFWASMQKLEESQAKHEEWQKRAEVRIDNGSFRADRLERVLKLTIKAGQRARRELREEDERFRQRFAVVTDAIAKLGEAQARSDHRLDVLIDIVREQRNGSA